MSEELILSPLEEETRRSNFKGLLPGQIDYPLGPLDPRLPIPIYLRLILEQRKILSAQVEIGWSHQGIEKLLEQASPSEACQIIRRVNPLCPNTYENFLRSCLGLEAICPEILKVEHLDYHLYFIRAILREIHEHSLLELSCKNFETFRKNLLSSKSVFKRLRDIGKISKEDAWNYSLTGPTLDACQEPYSGDVWSRILIKLETISSPNLDAGPEGKIIISCIEGRYRIRTPGFANAAALHLFLKGSDIRDIKIILLSLGLVASEIDR